MKFFIGTKQQVTPRTCMGAIKFFGILLLPLLFIFAPISLQAQAEWMIDGNTNNPNNGQPILGTLYPEPLRFYVSAPTPRKTRCISIPIPLADITKISDIMIRNFP